MAKPAVDIIALPIEVVSRIADSKFRLVHIASQRVRQLAGGELPIVETRSIKDTTISLEESLTGGFRITSGEEARIAKEEFRKRQEQARIEEQLSAKEEEIRKELSAYLSEAGAAEGESEDADEEAEEGAIDDESENPDEDAEENEE